MIEAQKKALIIKQHQVLSAPIKSILNAIFAAE